MAFKRSLFFKVLNNLTAKQELPTLPMVVVQALKVIKDERSGAADLEKIILADQVIASKLLKLVNSASFGLPNRISSVRQAITLIGFNEIKEIISTLNVLSVFSWNADKAFLDRKQLWQHSLAVALIGRNLSKKLNVSQPEVIFTAGLLHDIGKIFTDVFFHSDFMKVIINARKLKKSMYEVEKEVLGYTHTLINEWVCQKWNLPPMLSQPIIHHHKVLDAESYIYSVILIHVSDYIAKYRKWGFYGFENLTGLDPLILKKISITDLTPYLAPSLKEEKQYQELIKVFG